MSDAPDWVQGLLTRHRRLALDSSVLIYLLEGDPRRASAVGAVLDEAAATGAACILATVGIAEVLAGPARAGDAVGFEMLAAAVRGLGLEHPILDTATAEDAAWIRGGSGIALPDATHLACARAAGATAFLTNDRRIRSGANLEVVYLDDLVA